MSPVNPRFSADELRQFAGKTVPDCIKPNLDILFCGINPGLYTAATGHHFARPGNRFWPALFAGGLTPRVLHPSEEATLLDLGMGITSLIQRATVGEADLSKEEYQAGALRLEKTVKQYKPRWVVVLGMGAYRKGFGEPKAALGLQARTIGQVNVWLLPNPSGLNAHFTPKVLAILFNELRIAAGMPKRN